MIGARKTPNIHIRQPSRHSHRGQNTKLRPIPQINQERKKSSSMKPDPLVAIKKDFLEQENLTEQEQARIRKEAQKTANKKMRTTEVKIESEMISMLESECSKLGMEVEKQKADNRQLRFQVAELRKNIDFLSRKIENIYKDNQALTKNKDYEQMEKGQLKEQLQRLRISYQQLYKQKEDEARCYENQIKSLKDKLSEYINSSSNFEKKLEIVLSEKNDLEAQLSEISQEYQYLKELFEKNKKEWEQKRIEIEDHSKDSIDKKAQKITKLQTQLQILIEKLKEEEAIRKKIADKNQELQRQLSKKGEITHDLEDQISNLKKRVNDLSILKSSNNTILSQKLQQLTEQNGKLRRNIEIFKKKGVIPEVEGSKPFLFGPEETD